MRVEELIFQVEQKLNTKIVNDKIPIDDPLYKLMDIFGHKLFESELKRSGKKGEFFLFYILDYNINAYSLIIENAYIICITTGTMEMVPYWFIHVTDSEEFMELVGGKEKKAQVAGELIYYLLDFLMLHEFAHLICGHVKYLDKSCVCPFLIMMGMRDKLNIINKDNMIMDVQTLEYEADIFAGNYMCGYFLANDLPNMTYFVTEDKITRLKLITCAIIFLYNIVALYDRTLEKGKSLYLPSGYRFLNYTAVVLSNCERNPDWKLEKDQIISTLESIYPQTALEFYKLFKFKSLEITKIRMVWNELDVHVHTLEQHWSSIKNEVLRYSLWRLDEKGEVSDGFDLFGK